MPDDLHLFIDALHRGDLSAAESAADDACRRLVAGPSDLKAETSDALADTDPKIRKTILTRNNASRIILGEPAMKAAFNRLDAHLLEELLDLEIAPLPGDFKAWRDALEKAGPSFVKLLLHPGARPDPRLSTILEMALDHDQIRAAALLLSIGVRIDPHLAMEPDSGRTHLSPRARSLFRLAQEESAHARMRLAHEFPNLDAVLERFNTGDPESIADG